MTKNNKDAVERVVDVTNKNYEVIFIFESNLLESAVSKKLKEFEEFLDELNGKVAQKENWGQQDLAYDIKKHKKGTYVNYLVELPSDKLGELDDHLRISNDIIRHLVLSAPSEDYELNRHEESALAKKTFSTKQKHDLGKRRCSFCTNQVKYIDFKDVATLNHFIDFLKGIKKRYYTGTCLQHQKALTRAIKRARHMALVPFVN